MTRVLVLVEGQTEETFVKRVLGKHFAPRGVFLTPVILSTKRVKSGKKFKGGVTSYRQLLRDLLPLLGDSDATAVTTMIDYYALPEDLPGRASVPVGSSGVEKAAHVETALSNEVDDRRFRPYLSVHEFEALILAAPEEIEGAVPETGDGLESLSAAILTAGTPEEVNDGPETHPAARIGRLAPRYRKALHGPLITERIGIRRLRERCPHFDGWLSWIEGLASAA